MERNKRNTAIDLIKVFAIIGVIVIHVTSAVLTQTPVGSFVWSSGLIWGAVFRASVPLFFMTSGALMLDTDKQLSLKKLYFHNIARIVIAMLVWGFAYKLYHLSEEGQLNYSMIWYSIKRLLLFDQEFHFYYIHIILITYAFLPVTRIFVKGADKKQLLYAISLWAVLGLLYPLLRNFKPFNLLSGMTERWTINLTYSSIGYGLLGYYLKKYPITIRKGAGCFLAGFALVFGMTFYLSYKNGILNELFLQGTNPAVCLLAVGAFSVFSFVNMKGFLQKVVISISKASFCIYLSHMFILYSLEKIGIVALSFPAIISIPMISVCVLFICLGVYWVLSKIPFLNKYII